MCVKHSGLFRFLEALRDSLVDKTTNSAKGCRFKSSMDQSYKNCASVYKPNKTKMKLKNKIKLKNQCQRHKKLQPNQQKEPNCQLIFQTFQSIPSFYILILVFFKEHGEFSLRKSAMNHFTCSSRWFLVPACWKANSHTFDFKMSPGFCQADEVDDRWPLS